MYITRDYLKVSPWQAVIDMINDKYNFQLQAGIVKLKTMTALGPKRTQVEIIPNRSTDPANLMPEITQTIFTYDRLNCTEFFRNTVAVNISGLKLPITTFDVLKVIGDKNEIVFDVNDFIHQTFDHYSATGETDFVMQADKRSLRWVGSLKFRLINTGKVNLSSFANKNREYPRITNKQNPLYANGDVLLTRFDFTEYRDLLYPIPIGQYHDLRWLASMLSNVSGYLFTVTATPSPYNLTSQLVNGEPHCKVLYNGAVIPRWSGRSDFSRVMVIELNTTYSTGMSGYIRLHYN